MCERYPRSGRSVMARPGSAFSAISTKGQARFAFVDDGGSNSYLVRPAFCLQRVPWSLDLPIAPTLVASTAVVLLTLLGWPVAAFWRHRRKYALAARTVVMTLSPSGWSCRSMPPSLLSPRCFSRRTSDFTIFNDALDPQPLALDAFAWLGVFGVVQPTLAAAAEILGDTASAADGRVSITR